MHLLHYNDSASSHNQKGKHKQLEKKKKKNKRIELSQHNTKKGF